MLSSILWWVLMMVYLVSVTLCLYYLRKKRIDSEQSPSTTLKLATEGKEKLNRILLDGDRSEILYDKKDEPFKLISYDHESLTLGYLYRVAPIEENGKMIEVFEQSLARVRLSFRTILDRGILSEDYFCAVDDNNIEYKLISYEEYDELQTLRKELKMAHQELNEILAEEKL